ncbi:MAG: hypothetical protein ACI9FN_002857 [Saprospiraceae bacterium]
MKFIGVYLNFDVKLEEAFGFYEKYMAGKITVKSSFSEIPPDPNQSPLPEK